MRDKLVYIYIYIYTDIGKCQGGLEKSLSTKPATLKVLRRSVVLSWLS